MHWALPADTVVDGNNDTCLDVPHGRQPWALNSLTRILLVHYASLKQGWFTVYVTGKGLICKTKENLDVMYRWESEDVRTTAGRYKKCAVMDTMDNDAAMTTCKAVCKVYYDQLYIPKLLFVRASGPNMSVCKITMI